MKLAAGMSYKRKDGKLVRCLYSHTVDNRERDPVSGQLVASPGKEMECEYEMEEYVEVDKVVKGKPVKAKQMKGVKHRYMKDGKNKKAPNSAADLLQAL